MFLVFDIGGTNTRIAASRDGVHIENPVIYSTPKSFQDGITQFVTTATQLSGGEKIIAIAGGIAGPLDADKTMLVKAPNIPDWNGKPLAQELSKTLNAPVFLENDTAMWGLGEAAYGAGAGKRIVVYMTVSTGVGGCRIVDGAIDANAHGFEPGHMIIDPNGPICGCGGIGHLEALAGGAAMEKRYRKKPQNITDASIWDETTKHLAMGILNVAVIWSPECIVLGGSMMKSIRLEHIQSHLGALNTILPEFPEVSISSLQEKGGLLGSLAYAVRHTA
jgi:glucokinase